MADPLIRSLVPRRYQEAIFAAAAQKNTLVVLPTGLGKTAIAAMLAAHRLALYPGGKVLVVAPTRPLVLQHHKTFSQVLTLPASRLVVFTGTVPPARRQRIWSEAAVVFSTPQGLENDVLGAKISLEDVVLLIVDEAHRAVGDYSYVYVAKQYLRMARHPHLLGLTASPGSDPAAIKEVCAHLGIEHIEARAESDEDVAPYVQAMEINWVVVPLPPALRAVRDMLTRAFVAKLEEIKAKGFLDGDPRRQSKTTLLKLAGSLHARLAQGDKDFAVLRSISLVAEALKIQHAVELIETQGVHACTAYLERLFAQAQSSSVKAVKNLVADERVLAAKASLQALAAQGLEHPKLDKAVELVLARLVKGQDHKFIIFTQYRDQAELVVRRLHARGVTCEIFVGQAKKGNTGMSQKVQQEVLGRFRAGVFSCLVATSVAEEGLDIPAVQSVIFYEPIPSAIRTVQRKGRTARHGGGEVLVLVTKDTRDEAYLWTAHHKERRMARAVRGMAGALGGALGGAPGSAPGTLEPYVQRTDIKIFADFREKGGPVLKALAEAGVPLELSHLATGDFRLSDDVVVEYKTVADFVDSLVDGRLLAQLRMLRAHFSPLLIIEGTGDIFAVRNVSPAAIRGMLLSILFRFRIPILWSRSPKDTAMHLIALARLVQDPERPVPHLHFAKPKAVSAQQEYVVAGLPGLGPQLARSLLREFGSLACLMEAAPEELARVEKIGKKTAEALHEFLHREYAPSELSSAPLKAPGHGTPEGKS